MQRKQGGDAFHLPDYSIRRATFVTSTLIFCTILSLITSSCRAASTSHFSTRTGNGGAFQKTQVASTSGISVQGHSSEASATATTSLAASGNQLINVPYFTTAVPFNQTAIFWFGDVTSTDTYTDVRIGYNSSELYIDLQIVDHYLWYDPTTSSPDVTKGDSLDRCHHPLYSSLWMAGKGDKWTRGLWLVDDLWYSFCFAWHRWRSP